MADKHIQLKGRVFIEFNVEAVTGMHIGGSDTGIEIGGVDKTVIRDPLTNRPYIPGSSLKGKMRSLLEKYHGLPQNQRIGQGYIHTCQSQSNYLKCDVCQVFGVPGSLPGQADFGGPTRIIVRDVHLNEESARHIEEQARTDLPYTEAKTEVSIDRVTSAANPRQMERVVAGAVFGPGEIVYSIYDVNGQTGQDDINRLDTLIEGLQLMEDDYLGGFGTRGSGKVKLESIKVFVRGKNYLANKVLIGDYKNLTDFATDLTNLKQQIQQAL